MLALLISLLCWTPVDGVCSQALVSISPRKMFVRTGAHFKLSCEFTCLSAQHVAQLWRECGNKDKIPLVNVTSIHPNLTVELHINFATKENTGNYSCMTQPPDTISPSVPVEIADNWTETSILTTPSTPSTPTCNGTRQHSDATGLHGQMWIWMLLGKTVVFLLSFASLAITYKRG